MSNGNFFASLIELPYRIFKFDKKLSVHTNGRDNNYPERVERIINNSSTAKPAANLFKKFLIRKGFEGYNDIVVNPHKGTTLRQFLSDICQSYAYQKGAFVHVNVNMNGKITSMEVLEYKEGRVGKKDDKKYHGKIGFTDKWADGKVKDSDLDWFHVLNLKESVIKKQIESAGGTDKYKGQVFYINPESSIYPLSHVDNVMNDADSEYRASVFKNISLRKGFFGKTMVVTPPLLGEYAGVSEDEIKNRGGYEWQNYQLRQTERQNFEEKIKNFVGAENADGIMHFEMEFDDQIDHHLKFINIETNIDDKLFEYTEKSASANIRKAFNNIPPILIDNSDNSIFGDSGKAIEEAKIFYQEETDDDCSFISEKVNFLMKNFEDFKYPSSGMKIQNLVNRKEVDNAVD